MNGRLVRVTGVALLSVGTLSCASSPRAAVTPEGAPIATPSGVSVPAPVTVNQSIRAADDIPTGTERDADTLLVELQRLDSTIVVDMRYRGTDNFTGAPLPGYEANRAFLHREAAAAFARVQQALAADGLSLKVYDAYRPVRATLAMVAWTQRMGRESLVRDGYISDRSRHNLGVAIDCTLVERATGRELDMGTPFDTFSSAAHTANATGTAATNRARLVAAMSREGFANYEQEWWHYSYTVSAPRRFDLVIR